MSKAMNRFAMCMALNASLSQYTMQADQKSMLVTPNPKNYGQYLEDRRKGRKAKGRKGNKK